MPFHAFLEMSLRFAVAPEGVEEPLGGRFAFFSGVLSEGLVKPRVAARAVSHELFFDGFSQWRLFSPAKDGVKKRRTPDRFAFRYR